MGAKLVKAEILGNSDLAKRLKAQLDEARAVRYGSQVHQNVLKSNFYCFQREEHLRSGGSKTVEEVVVLTRTDGRGLTRPGEST